MASRSIPSAPGPSLPGILPLHRGTRSSASKNASWPTPPRSSTPSIICRASFGSRDYTRIDLTGGVFDILERECHQQISSNVAHLKASCGDESIRAAMRLAPGEAMLLLDEVCFNRLCRPVMRSLSYYTNFFDFFHFTQAALNQKN